MCFSQHYVLTSLGKIQEQQSEEDLEYMYSSTRVLCTVYTHHYLLSIYIIYPIFLQYSYSCSCADRAHKLKKRDANHREKGGAIYIHTQV